MRARESMVHIDRMAAIEIRPARHSPSVSSPERPLIALSDEPERVGMLAEAVEVGILGKFGLETEELALEDEI